ncbi:MAG TPA: outer membrane lipid asymmetry maintenance protein MlaD [Candidatus Acidoferrales bacterium]|jgi:phospholipid/cholesterol/gamma-HCH transport system substrate-binding protein|nr:outer membrane lipid asymmetry maintenance protein MlaD [Candidatus Acidoferrum sp.]HXN13098.1 outer membrane lipid asymmetry maintenance protein MlaD [Candidatus Acidoferrales bacterium]
MYASRTTQFIVGIFAILGIIALAILSLSLGKISLLPTPGYTLYASFDNISGLKTGDQVQLAGVQIGKVVDIGIKEYRAQIAMRINQGVEIDQDSIAAIKTSGIIGDKYVSIQLGPSDHYLTNGGTIQQTQSAFVLEDAIGQLINSSGSSSDKSSNSNGNCTDNKAPNQPGKSVK